MPFTYDTNEELRNAVAGLFGLVPVAGSALSAFVEMLWPDDSSGVDPWEEMKANVESLIKKSIDDQVEKAVDDTVTGMGSALKDFTKAMKDAGRLPSQRYSFYSAAKVFMDGNMPDFSEEGYEVELLPLYAQAATLYLAMLRLAVLDGPAKMDMQPADHQAVQQELTAKIKEFTDHVTTFYNSGMPTSDWAAINKYKREMTLRALDFAAYWPYSDPSQYPNGGKPLLTREILSDPQGRAVFSDDLIAKYNYQAEGGKLSSITVWGRNDHKLRNNNYRRFIAGVEVVWGENSPGDVGPLDSGIMGAGSGKLPFDDNNKNTNVPPVGGSWSNLDTKGNAMVEAWGYSGDIVEGLGFTQQSGKTTQKTDLMGSQGMFPGPEFSWKFPGHVLSSITALGVYDDGLIKNGYGYAAGGVVFGFRFEDSYDEDGDDPDSLQPADPSSAEPQ